MKRNQDKALKHRGFSLFLSIIIVFLILGTVVFSVARKISGEMSLSAVHNLSENLNLIKSTIEAILTNEAEFQLLISNKLAQYDDPMEYVLSYEPNDTMVKMSLIMAGETEGLSHTGEPFSEEELDFSGDRTIAGLPVSRSYVSHMGTWAYTIKSPVVKDGTEIAALYIEYVYDSLNRFLPRGFYDNQAVIYLMDSESERFVLKPEGMGMRTAGHLNLTDFYRANSIVDAQLRTEVNDCINEGKNILFYHDIRQVNSLNYMWSVNGGSIYLVGYVAYEAIQQEGRTVNQNILLVVVIMLVAFLLCCILYYFNQRQHIRIRKEQEAEREIHNKQLTEALQAAQIASHSKTMFLSNMSHDIRTPMNAVLGFAALLDKNADQPEKVKEYTRKITSSGQHLLGLINDVLDISKIESGKVVLSFEEFSLNDVLSSINAIIRPMANAKKQSFQIEVEGIDREYLIGDETRISQILINLLSNAVKYTQEGGDIRLRITGLEQRSSQYERIRMEVEDNGYGMTPEFLKTIFDAFTRAENSTTNKVQGTGLGMAITKSIVELMGGTIDVSSEVGRGSLFRTELEFRIPEEHRKEEKPKENEACSLKGLHFLAAEDNEINAEILAEFLKMEGASCKIAENGKLAVECFENAPEGEFDAILMDVQMPVMNGYEATAAIRSMNRRDAGEIPIIAMTANAFAEDEKDALNAGMNAHIAKPLDVEQVKRVIRQHIQKKSHKEGSMTHEQ